MAHPTHRRSTLLALAAALVLSACATPGGQQQQSATAPVAVAPPAAPTPPPPPPVTPAEQAILRNWVVQQDRLYRVGAPLLSNNTELCKGNARNLLGFTAKNRYSYSADFADAAQQTLGLDERLHVMDVLPGSGAAKAGIKRGDVVVSAEGKPMPTGPNATRDAGAVLGPLVVNKKSVNLNIQRGERAMSVSVPLTNACAFAIELGNSDAIAAYSDGRRILATRGMLKYARSDDELALVLAREMAHNILTHPQKQKSAVSSDAVIDNMIRMHPDRAALNGSGGIKPMPQALDIAADNLALHLAARAGYRIDNALAFWVRMISDLPPSVANGYTVLHPATPARMAAMERAIAAVKAKQAAGKPLLP